MIPQTISGREDGFSSGVLAATLFFFGLFDLFLVLYVYALSRGWLGSMPYLILFAFTCYVVTVQDRRVLPYYLIGLWLSTGAFVIYLLLLSVDGGLSFLNGFAQAAAALVVAATLTILSPRVGPLMARRRAQGKLA